jgi:putative PIN family toxin of toxin-antitoxin system
VKIVLDTNTVVSGLLWRGASRQVLDQAKAGKITLFTSIELLTELADVLKREKFSLRLKQAEILADDLVLGYATLATVVRPEAIQPVIKDDPDDDKVLACARACEAVLIVSGDHHLLDLGKYEQITILKSDEFLTNFS